MLRLLWFLHGGRAAVSFVDNDARQLPRAVFCIVINPVLLVAYHPAGRFVEQSGQDTVDKGVTDLGELFDRDPVLTEELPQLLGRLQFPRRLAPEQAPDERLLLFDADLGLDSGCRAGRRALASRFGQETRGGSPVLDRVRGRLRALFEVISLPLAGPL